MDGGFSGKERTDGGVLDLLLVCRRVYVIFTPSIDRVL